MASVTVPGTGGNTITQTFDNGFNSALAQSIADALAAALGGGNLFQATTDGSAAVPTNVSGKLGELIIVPGTTGNITVPASAHYSFVVDNSQGPDTIFGSPGLSIMGGGGTHTIIDPAAIVLGDTTSGSTNNITVTGAGDNVAVGNGTNTLTGTGSGTLSGGTGTNTFIETLGSYVINSQGAGDTIPGDTIRAGAGATTVNVTGNDASVIGAGGAVTANLAGDRDILVGGTVIASGGVVATASGTSDTIIGGAGSAGVNLASGAVSAVVTAGGAELSVLDHGTSDTINAGSGSTSVNAPGGSFVQGGSGLLNFVGGTGPSTIIGGSGNSTIFGGTGLTSVAGGAGGAMEYVNTTSGALSYQGGNGNETIDASLSKSPNSMFGGLDSTGQNLLIGGAGNDVFLAGKGAETMLGGGGSNSFYFLSANGGPAVNVVIADFSAIDSVLLTNYGAGAAGAAVAGATTVGSSTTITLSDNTRITFTGMSDPNTLYGHIASS